MAKREVGQWWSDAKKVEAVKTWLIVGNGVEVASIIGVPYQTLRHWRTFEWWKEIEDQLKAEEDLEVSAKLQARISKSLDIVLDRLENGDFQYDPRTGKFVRKPVALKDTWRVADEMMKRRDTLVQRPLATSAEGVNERILKLAEDFAAMATRKRKAVTFEMERAVEDVPDGKGENNGNSELPEGIRQLSGQAGTDQTPC